MGIKKSENNKLIIDEINPDSPCPSLLNSTNIYFTVIGIVTVPWLLYHESYTYDKARNKITWINKSVNLKVM